MGDSMGLRGIYELRYEIKKANKLRKAIEKELKKPENEELREKDTKKILLRSMTKVDFAEVRDDTNYEDYAAQLCQQAIKCTYAKKPLRCMKKAAATISDMYKITDEEEDVEN